MAKIDFLFTPLWKLIEEYDSMDDEFVHDFLIGEFDHFPLARVIIEALDSELSREEKVFHIFDSVDEIDHELPVLDWLAAIDQIRDALKRISADA
jgi:hypothetical protein